MNDQPLLRVSGVSKFYGNRTGCKDVSFELWPGEGPGMPGELPVETVVDRGEIPDRLDRAVSGITRPRLAVCRPTEPDGSAVLTMPGGGFARVVIDRGDGVLGRRPCLRGSRHEI